MGHKDRNNRPLAYELAVNAAKHEIVEVTVKGDSSPEILVPRPVPFTRYSGALNRWLQPIMPTSTSMTPHAMVFHTKKTVAQVQHILTTRHVVGRVWSTVFPQQDTYIYNSEKGDVTVITLIRVAQKGRTVFGMDLWYPHYSFVGRYGIPDFYKVMPFTDVNDIHSRQWEAVLVANRRSTVTIKKCAEPKSTTTPTTYTTTPTTERVWDTSATYPTTTPTTYTPYTMPTETTTYTPPPTTTPPTTCPDGVNEF